MSRVFDELKRRNVFKVGIAYLVAAWLLMQITDIVAPALPADAFIQLMRQIAEKAARGPVI